jgi:hypothetical protein
MRMRTVSGDVFFKPEVIDGKQEEEVAIVFP